MTDFLMNAGDELVIIRRRTTVIKALQPEEEDTTRVENTEMSVVRCPETITVTGGSVEPEFDGDNRLLMIRLKVR